MEKDEESKKGRTHSNTFAYNWLFTTIVSCRELRTSAPNPAMNISTMDPPNARGQINADSQKAIAQRTQTGYIGFELSKASRLSVARFALISSSTTSR